MEEKRLRRTLISIKKKCEAIINSYPEENPVSPDTFEMIDQIKQERVII